MAKLLKLLFFILVLTSVLIPRTYAVDPNDQQACVANGGTFDPNTGSCKSVDVKVVQVGPCDPSVPNNFAQLCRNTNTSTISHIIQNIIVTIMVIAAILALLFLIWGGIKWIMSGGDKAKVDAARSTIIAAVIGLILTLLSFFILSVVLHLFGLNLSDLTIPTLPNK